VSPLADFWPTVSFPPLAQQRVARPISLSRRRTTTVIAMKAMAAEITRVLARCAQ
jgi:hypothetical protein